MKSLIFLFVLCAAFLTVDVRADIAPPKPTPTAKAKSARQIDSQIGIRLDKSATEARLIVPQKMVKDLRAALDEADDANSPVAGLSSTNTIIAGLLMSLAVVCGGVWFARGKRAGGKTAKVTAAVALIAIGGASAVMVSANIAPPQVPRRLNGDLFNRQQLQRSRFLGDVKVELSKNATRLELIVPDDAEDGGAKE